MNWFNFGGNMHPTISREEGELREVGKARRFIGEAETQFVRGMVISFIII